MLSLYQSRMSRQATTWPATTMAGVGGGLEATQREARRIGYVLPGEQLFVVKGIPAWRRAQRTLRDDG